MSSTSDLANSKSEGNVTPEIRTFLFNFNKNGVKFSMECPISIPVDVNTNEYAGRLMKAHDLPCFVQDELESKLLDFVKKETEDFYDRRADSLLSKLQNGQVDVNLLASQWGNAFQNEVLEFTQPEAVGNELVFSEVYHTLIHSPALETLLNLEHKYSIDMEAVIENRDRDLSALEEKQHREMEDAMARIGNGMTDEHINQLAQSQFENSQLAGSKWASELSVLRESQKRQYREWVMTVHEDTQTARATPQYLQKVRALSNPGDPDREDESLSRPRREESFTVHLGAQLKTTHNIRLVCADVLDLCKHKPSLQGSTIMPPPQRLQTAMSLFSDSLCGLVVLVDNRLNSYTGIKREFAKVCDQSTDFHFPTLEQQFQTIEESVEQAIQWRKQKSRHDQDGSDAASIKSAESGGSFDRDEKSLRLHAGDFYITRHSNLSEVHIVFHLVCDDSVSSSVSDISSRHPVILGYRNILKSCFRHNVHTVTLPLFLNHEMVEEMTIPWCLKRAELVFKCVKGFMMELATWSAQESRTIQFLVPKMWLVFKCVKGFMMELATWSAQESRTIQFLVPKMWLVFKCVKGFMMELATWSAQESRTIQFLVPKTLSDDTFQQINALLPSIFRMSNPVMLAK